MKIDESRMKEYEEPTILRRLGSAVISLIFGLFFVYIFGVVALLSILPNLIFYIQLSITGLICFTLGWVYGDEFTSYLHANIVDRWDPMNRFR
jgi:hypothetical protein